VIKSSCNQPCEFGHHRGLGFLEFWLDELVLVCHSTAVNHRINFNDHVIGYVEHLVKQVIKNKVYTSDLHRINGFMLQRMFRLSNEQAKQKLEELFCYLWENMYTIGMKKFSDNSRRVILTENYMLSNSRLGGTEMGICWSLSIIIS